MGNAIHFDLNAAILHWQEELRQSPQFRAENLAELESHLRDAVVRLRASELSEEEAFLVATRRVGSVEQLASEFEKVNPNPMNKIAHGLVLLFFSTACWLLWALLTLSAQSMSEMLEGEKLPGFTRLCYGLSRDIWVLPLLALIWCVFVWFRKPVSRNSWVAFFAASASVIILATLLTAVAVYLPMVRAFEQYAGK